jgi:hypothetical protein
VLYRPEAYESLTDEPWDEERVRAGIRAIVADADEAFGSDTLWPAHEWDGWQAALPMKNLYVGAAGVIWALDELRQRGHAASELDLAGAAQRALELWRAEPDFMQGETRPDPAESALLTGESGLLLVAWRLSRTGRLADDLLGCVRANIANDANDLMWGTPGTALAARAMHAWTGEERWADAWRESAEAVRAGRDEDGLWTQRLDGEEYRGLGPMHGVAGNALVLLGGDDPRNEALARETAAVLARNAFVEDGLANWPSVDGRDIVRKDGRIKLQWCSGGPGIVVSAADYLDEELLLAGAELVWQAGPHDEEKGHGLCHGTSGNGFALLKAFARTGDESWLERARRFAVHALAQSERLRFANGRSRYSLWTGDVGTALFAAACLDADARFPVLETAQAV